MRTLAQHLLRDRRAVTAVEYALIGALICVVCIGVLSVLGASLEALFDAIEGSMAAG